MVHSPASVRDTDEAPATSISSTRGARMINEEIEMKPSLALLRLGNGLKGHERRSVLAVVAPLDRHVSAFGRPGTPRVSEEAFPERGQLRRVSAVHRDSHLS